MSAFDLYTTYDFLWFFACYSLLGWCAEVAFAAVCEGRFVNRGFLNGPVCPIYGFGVVIVIAALTPLKESGFALFVGSVILTSALEWVTGFILEKVFRDKWWDYSDTPFNLNGYICLKFSLIWGFACVFIMDIFHPTVVKLIGLIPYFMGCILIAIVLVLFAVDAGVTAGSILKLNKRLAQMDEVAAKLRETSDRLGETISENVVGLMEKSEEWKEKSEEFKEDLLEKKEDIQQKAEDIQDALQETAETIQETAEAIQETIQDTLEERLLRIQSEKKRRQLELQAQIGELREKYEELAGKKKFIHKRMIKAFPGMKSRLHQDAFEELKKRYGSKK